MNADRPGMRRAYRGLMVRVSVPALMLSAVLYSGCDDQCYRFESTVAPMGLVSGPAHLAASWVRREGEWEGVPHETLYGAMIAADGTLGPQVELTNGAFSGTAGMTTTLWHSRGSGNCDTQELTGASSTALLVRDATVQPIYLAPNVTIHSAVFDGADYQLFTITNSVLRHQSIGEDGLLGPVHELGTYHAYCLYAASDGAGELYVLVAGYPSVALAIDPATGGSSVLWTDPDNRWAYYGAFWFAGELHVQGHDLEGLHILSITPETGTVRARTLAPEVMTELGQFWAGPTHLFASTAYAVFVLDADLAVVARYPIEQYEPLATVDTDFVRFVEHSQEEQDGIEAVRRRGDTGADAWRTEVAASPPIPVECPPPRGGLIGCDSGAGGAEPLIVLSVIGLVRRRRSKTRDNRRR